MILQGPPKIYEFIDFDVTLEKISLNVPLHRFLINLLIEAPRHRIEANLAQRITNSVSSLQLLEPVLQTIVAVAQITTGMWKRNGNSAESQAFLVRAAATLAGHDDALHAMLDACLNIIHEAGHSIPRSPPL